MVATLSISESGVTPSGDLPPNKGCSSYGDLPLYFYFGIASATSDRTNISVEYQV
jgi:hypothetical protein